MYSLGVGKYYYNITASDNDESIDSIYFNEFTLGYPCYYSGVGDYNVDCSVCSTLLADYNVGGNNVIMTGSGTVELEADITNWGYWDIFNPCIFDIYSGYELVN